MTDFAERLGLASPRSLQSRSMDQHLRNALWNWVCWALEKPKNHNGWSEEYYYRAAAGGVWDEILHAQNDTIPINPQSQLKKWYMNVTWLEVYRFIEYLLPRVNSFRGDYDKRDPNALVERLNYLLEREMSGFRMIQGQLVEVTAPAEIAEIERAATSRKGFEGVAQHINTALALLGKKPDPDYRNSIKESISAVETAAKLLAGKDSHGIEPALNVLVHKHKLNLHSQFKAALQNLYNWTSDADGVRHAILDEPTVGDAEARFMLVTCSAFANWLIAVADTGMSRR